MTGQTWPIGSPGAGRPWRATLRQPQVGTAQTLPRALALLFLAVILIQGFHVVEHIVVVIQYHALSYTLAEANGLLGARADFEWLHFSYNLSFLGTLALLLIYIRTRQAPDTPWSIMDLALLGAVGLQMYHVGEHVLRVVQYVQADCHPCVGLIGKVVTFIWPHLFFGIFAYIPMVAAYFGYRLYRPIMFSPDHRAATTAPEHIER